MCRDQHLHRRGKLHRDVQYHFSHAHALQQINQEQDHNVTQQPVHICNRAELKFCASMSRVHTVQYQRVQLTPGGMLFDTSCTAR